MTTFPIRPALAEHLGKSRKGAAAILRLHRLKVAEVRVEGDRLCLVFDSLRADESRDFDRLPDSDRAALAVDCPPQFVPLFVGPDWPEAVDAALAAGYAAWREGGK